MGYSDINTVNLMYRVMEEMAKLNYPIVFKGALVLKLITDQGVNTQRLTKDIDGDWQDPNHTGDQIRDLLQYAIDRLGIGNIVVEKYRDRPDLSSLGFKIKSGNKLIFSMDIAKKRNVYGDQYVTSNNVVITGQNVYRICADKLSAISSRTVFRRSKDVYDLYLLTSMISFETRHLRPILDNYETKLGDFRYFKDQTDGVVTLEQGYAKLKGVVNKPSYEEVYNRVREFIRLFDEEDYTKDYIWVNNGHQGFRWIGV